MFRRGGHELWTLTGLRSCPIRNGELARDEFNLGLGQAVPFTTVPTIVMCQTGEAVPAIMSQRRHWSKS